MVFLDEAFFAGAKRDQGALKALITERTLLMEPKGIDPFPVDNFAHIFAATNEEWAVPAELDDRRLFVLKTSDHWSFVTCRGRIAERKAYFDRLWGSLAAGGYAALLSLLQTRDIREFDVFDVPETRELVAQKLHTLRGAMKWLYDCVYSERLLSGSWPLSATNDDLYQEYTIWCDKHREHKLSSIVFGRTLSKFLWIGGKNQVKNGVRQGKIRSAAEVKKRLPPLEVMKMENIEYLWSSGEWTSALVASSDDDQ